MAGKVMLDKRFSHVCDVIALNETQEHAPRKSILVFQLLFCRDRHICFRLILEVNLSKMNTVYNACSSSCSVNP